jgi:KamA family protein
MQFFVSPKKSLSAVSTRYIAYTLSNYKTLPQIERLSDEQKFAIDVVGSVLPFKTNSYVVNELINWDNIPNDPMFILNFPQKEMLDPVYFDEMAKLLREGASKEEIRKCANIIREDLNPHSSGQLDYNRPTLNGELLSGMQHKYKETVLYFPSQGQTCHAYCTFCFRWPQFVGIDSLRFAMRETELLINYIKKHSEVTDLLFTGGDPMIMKSKTLASYIRPILAADIPHLQTIRFGSKSLSYWPHRFVTDADADDLLSLFEEIIASGRHLSFMANFNSLCELETDIVQEAIGRIRATGAQVRTQSPLLQHINDDPAIWADMWKKQVKLGCVPYYMFVARDTGAYRYFGLPLVRAWEIYRQAYQQVSGIARTVRGPSMSASPGKVQVVGVSEIRGEKVLVMQMLQGRDSDWVRKPFFATYDEKASWLDELKPAFGEERFFFDEE